MHQIIEVIDSLLEINVVLPIILGEAIGIVLGFIPGLTAAMGMAMVLPMTFYMKPLAAIAMLVAAYKGGIYGGSISAIIFSAPGTPAAGATILDGYPMARQGKGGKALKIALWASVMGDLIASITLVLVAGWLARIALRLSAPEFCSDVNISIYLLTA